MTRASAGLALRLLPRNPIDTVWRVLASPRLAAVNLLLLALGAILGSLLPQAPPELQPGSPEYAIWLDQLRWQLGGVVPFLVALGLFDLHEAWWFRILLSWLGVSLGVYVLSSLRPALMNSYTERRARKDTTALNRTLLQCKLGVEQAEQEATASLRSLGYTVRVVQPSRQILLAEKHRWQRLANLLSHLGAALLLLAAAIGHLLGWQEPTLTVSEGATVSLGHDTHLSVRNDGFSVALHPDGSTPRDYLTRVTLLENDRVVVKERALRVNSPLSYKGVNLHQAFFGPAVELRVTDAAGRVLHSGGIALTAEDAEGRPAAVVELDGYRLQLITPRTDGTDRVVPAGMLRVRVHREDDSNAPLAEVNLRQGERATVGGLGLLFLRESQYTGLHVTSNPAVPWIWASALLMLSGMTYTFAFPYRRIQVQVREKEWGSEIGLGIAGGRPMGREAEAQRVVARLTSDLGARESSRQGGAERRRYESVS